MHVHDAINSTHLPSSLMQCGGSYSDLSMLEDSSLDGMILIDSGSSPDCLISKSLAASLSVASLLSLSDIAFNSLCLPSHLSVHALQQPAWRQD